MDLPIGSNVEVGGGLSGGLPGISSADPSNARDAMSEPNRARMAPVCLAI